jgi:hypothetical protein
MRRRDMSLLLLSATADAALGAESADQHDHNPAWIQRTEAEAVAGVSPTNLNYPEGDSRRYGANVASADNSAAINFALLVSANGGSAAFIPAGTWRITSPLHCTLGSSMYGAGQQSIIAPKACDGMTFDTQPAYCASRFFRDFQIIGADTAGDSGITANLTAPSTKRVTGIQFSNITIQNFAVGIFARGIWNSSFRDCFLYNNFCGYHFHGQSILINIDGGFVQQGSVAGSGTSYGVLVDSIDGESCQSLHMNGVGIYGYDVNISLILALYTSIVNCDISVANSIGVQLVTVHGGTTVRDCWIQTNSTSATTGIQIADRATAEHDKIVIEGCTLVCNKANAASVGIYVGSNQLAVDTNSNSIGTATAAFAIGISNGGAHNHVVKFNSIYASAKALLINSSAFHVEVGPNNIQNGTPLVFTARTAPGFSYYATGVFAFELGGMSKKVQGNMHWAANGHSVLLSVTDEGLVGTSSSNAMSGIGLPAYLAPTSRRSAIVHVVDKGVAVHGNASIGPDGIVVFTSDANGATFAESGTKGLPAAATIAYHL